MYKASILLTPTNQLGVYKHKKLKGPTVYKNYLIYRVKQKKRELLKNPTKIEENQEKKLFTEVEPLKLAF